MSSIDSTDLAAILFRALVDYGQSSDEKTVDSLSEVYTRSMATVDVNARLRMLTRLSDLAEQRKLSANALLPFVFRDTDQAVVSSAALSLAELWPGSESDPVLGIRELASYARNYAERDDEPRAVAILSGLLLLGDRRAIDLLQNCWRWLSSEGRVRLSHMESGYLHAPLIDWYIDWLADCEQSDFGVVAAALTRISQKARGQLIPEVTRVIPAWLADDGNVVRLVQQWTFAEFGERIRPRLEEIARHESEPRLMPAVLEAWQIHPPQSLRGIGSDLPSGEHPRDLLTLVAPDALKRSTDIHPFPVFEQELLAAGGDLIVCWGIFNPYGPTLSCFGRLKTPQPDLELLFYRMLNPFRQDSFVVGTLVGADRTDGATVARILHFRFLKNWVANLGTSPLFLIGNGAPTFVSCPWDNAAFQAAMPRIFIDSPAIRGCNLAQSIDYMRRYPLRPWDRTAEQRDRAFAQFLAVSRGEEAPKIAAEGVPSTQEVVETWYGMVSDRDHVMVELACLPGAWNGSIEHCGSPELQASAYPLHRVNTFLAAFKYPILEVIARAVSENR